MWIPKLQDLGFLAGMSSAVMAAAHADELTLLAKANRTLTPEIVRQVEKKLQGVCDYSDNPSFKKGNIPGGADPARHVLYTLQKMQVKAPSLVGLDKIRVIQSPANGDIKPGRLIGADESLTQTYSFYYTPKPGFLGEDRAVFEVDINGQKIRVGYVFHVGINEDMVCPLVSERDSNSNVTIQVPLDNRFLDQTEAVAMDTNLESWLALSQLQSYVAGLTGSSLDEMLNALFSDGSQAGGLINGVIIGGSSGKTNTYPNIRTVLNKLGFEYKSPAVKTLPSLQNFGPHYHHFHVYLQAPKAEKLGTNLLVATPTDALNLVANTAGRPLNVGLVRQIENRLSARCTTAQSDTKDYSTGYRPGNLSPDAHVLGQLKKLRIQAPSEIGFKDITLLVAPKHGTVKKVEVSPGNGYFDYIPNKRFAGEDKAVFEVLVNGYKIRVGYTIKVFADNNPNNPGNDCDDELDAYASNTPSDSMGISITLDNSFLNQTEVAAMDTNLESWLALSQLQSYVAGLTGSTFDFVDSTGQSISRTYSMQSTDSPHIAFFDNGNKASPS